MTLGYVFYSCIVMKNVPFRYLGFNTIVGRTYRGKQLWMWLHGVRDRRCSRVVQVTLTRRIVTFGSVQLRFYINRTCLSRPRCIGTRQELFGRVKNGFTRNVFGLYTLIYDRHHRIFGSYGSRRKIKSRSISLISSIQTII